MKSNSIRFTFFSLFIISYVLILGQNNLHAQEQNYYLGYNLWFQNADKILSLNPKIGKHLPAGIEIDQVRSRGGRTPVISFRVIKLNKKFVVYFYPKYHKGLSFEDFKNALIQTKSFRELTAGLTPLEIQNIVAAKVEPGMSRRAVLIAYGPPPLHKTPSLEANKWYYWTKKSGRPFAINFDPNGYTTKSEVKPAVVSKDRKTPTVGKDTSPPVIVITDPPVSRGMKPKHKEKTYIVRGNASDRSGVFEVLVNGVEANLQSSGSFWAEVLLAVGENQIRVKATDTKKNTAEQTFSIIREGEAAPPPIASPATEISPEIKYAKYYALIIAIEEYGDQSINDLDQPIDDARHLRDILIRDYTFKPQDVVVLENPDRSTIMRNFETLSKKISKNDNLFIFYAGHGYWDDKFQQGYWLPSNATKGSRTQWISNSTVVDYIRGIESNHTLLVTDACFSGGIFKTRKAFTEVPPAVTQLHKLPSRKAMTSGTLKEVPDRSVFVEYLTKRLEDNTEKFLTSEQLFVSFRTAVINNSPIQQIPQYGEIRQCGDEGGDFIFIKK